jgi:hypothetical protein
MKKPLLLGDFLALAITTLIGFITHRETDISFAFRFAAIYFPLSIFWVLFARLFKLFQPEIAPDFKQLWRVPLAMLFAAPLAVVVRSFILQTEIIPIFMLALGATSAIGMLIWRGIYLLYNRNKPK